ncbi:unnamed protein product, partial [Didymodactylos carnosus]
VWWSKWFREGGEQIETEPRPGRSVTEATSENIEEVRGRLTDAQRAERVRICQENFWQNFNKEHGDYVT